MEQSAAYKTKDCYAVEQESSEKGMTTGHGITKAEYKKTLRLSKRARKKEAVHAAELAASQRSQATKARVCKHCGHWIRKVHLFYLQANGINRDCGWAYIHYRKKFGSDSRYLYTIERCYPEPRPIPQREDESV